MEINDRSHYQLLVVGGTGFIGQHIVKRALAQGFDTTVLTKNDCNVANKLDGVIYLSSDISHKSSLLTQLKGKEFDCVINLGGYVNHANYSNGGSKTYDVHFNGVRNLVDCLDKSRIKSFIQIGSSDEYGNNPAPQSEAQREAPISPYSCAKVASTHFLQTLYKTENFPAVILRPFLVYGPGQGEERFIPQVIKACINNQKFPTSKGEQLRDFCFIDDFVQAVFTVLANNNVYGEVVNISSGRPVFIKQVVDMIVSIVGSGRPQFGRVCYRDGENMALYADIEKAKNLLDWKPDFDLEQGLIETIEWVKIHNVPLTNL
jgi:nucleoside-diphosphate-sugar epimerase